MTVRALTYIAVMLLLPVGQLAAQKQDSLTAFIDKNPNAVDYQVVYKGTLLNLSADENDLLINLSVAHPTLQMRFLMQKASLYIDPSGKRRKNYEVALPSAFDVKDEIEAVARPEGKTVQEGRPDIRPLISALNKKGAELRHVNTSTSLGYQRFHVEIDQNTDVLNYYVLLPKDLLMQDKKLSDKWAVGIFSINDFANMPPPEQEGGGGMMPPPMEGENAQDILELMQQDIRQWVKFSIDEVNNANLKE